MDKEKKFIILGNFDNTRDFHCRGCKDNLSTREMLSMIVNIFHEEGMKLIVHRAFTSKIPKRWGLIMNNYLHINQYNIL